MTDEPTSNLEVEVSTDKVKLKADVPQSVMLRGGNAVLDAISPFTEGMGIIGDHLRYHREKVIIKIVNLAQEKIKNSGDKIKPISPKFMVPFIEKSSCEDMESELIDAWANLLKEENAQKNPGNLLFLDILSKLDTENLWCLTDLIEEKYIDGFNPHYLDFSSTILNPVSDIVKDMELYWPQFESIWRALHSIKFSIPAKILSIEIPFTINHEDIDVSDCDGDIDKSGNNFFSYQILSSLGLVDFVSEKFYSLEDSAQAHSLSVNFVRLTHLGFMFYLTCTQNITYPNEVESNIND